MSKETVVEVHGADLGEHPAFLAWRKIMPGYNEPDRITILKKKRSSTVFRMEGVGPGGAAVIAKRCKPAAAAIERVMYEEVFPSLPVPALRLYGSLNEDSASADGERCWLFMQDAGHEKYSCLSGEHRALAGRWLAAVHSTAADLRFPIRLQDRAPNYYLGELRSLRETIERSFDNPALNADDLLTLQAILTLCGVLESHWGQIAELCETMPSTLVHGDLAAKNVRIQTGQAENTIVVMDWETVGWGTPAIDLAQFVAHSLSPDLAVYSSVVQFCRLDAGTLARMAEVGNIFRLVVTATWESQSLPGSWPQRPMRNMRLYQAALADCIRLAGWRD